MLVDSLMYPELYKIIVLQVRYTFVAIGVRFNVIELELMSRLVDFSSDFSLF
jgi:hypothetical protein